MFCFLIGQRNNVLSADWLIAWYLENRGMYNTRTLLCSVHVQGTVRHQRGCYYKGISLGAENVHTQICR